MSYGLPTMIPVIALGRGDKIFPETRSGETLLQGIVVKTVLTNGFICVILEDGRELYYDRQERVYSSSLN